jgi:predicted Kef-type K+ transport protein
MVLATGAAIFLYWFFSDSSKWWAAIPGFTLAGMAASSLLLDKIGWGGLAFLGGIGVGFWAIYIRQPARWWAIIPGGVLLTLGFTSALSEVFNIGETGGVFFLGLGLTFLLLTLLAKMKWAIIPAAVLLLFGFFLGTPFVGVLEYSWIGILLIAGIVLVVSAIRSN